MLFFQSTTDSHCRISAESPENKKNSWWCYHITSKNIWMFLVTRAAVVLPWWCIASESPVPPSERPGLRVSSPHPENDKAKSARFVSARATSITRPAKLTNTRPENKSMTHTVPATITNMFTFLSLGGQDAWHSEQAYKRVLFKHQKLSVSTDIILSSHMLYKLWYVKKRLQASSGEAIKFKCSFEVRKHWVDWSLDERKPFWFDSKAVRGKERKDLLSFLVS